MMDKRQICCIVVPTIVILYYDKVLNKENFDYNCIDHRIYISFYVVTIK